MSSTTARIRRLAREGGITRSIRDGHVALLRSYGKLGIGFRAKRSRSAGGRLRVLAHVPGYPPARRAGSELSMHAVMRDLDDRGHHVRVLVEGDGLSGFFDGVEVLNGPGRREVHELYRWSDVILTQLGSRNRAIRLSALHDRPTVVFLRLGGLDPKASFGRIDLLVFVSEWLRLANPWDGRSMVLHSPIKLEDYRTTPGDAITLVGLSEFKGASVFYALAELMPDRSFVGVCGAWGEQIVRHDLENVRIMKNVTDMRTVYAQTRVLLMPSRFETLGRVGREAAASGIPTIASDCAGIREALGSSGLFVPDRSDVEEWARQIEALDNPAEYEQRGRQARQWVETHAFAHELDAFEARIVDLVASQRHA